MRIAQRSTIIASIERERRHLLEVKRGFHEPMFHIMRGHVPLREIAREYVADQNRRIAVLLALLEEVDEADAA